MKKRITGLFLILIMLCVLISVAQAEPKNGWIVEGDYLLYYQDDKPVTGTQTINSSAFFFTSEGYLKGNGKVQNTGSGYYYPGTDHKLLTGWQTVREDRYYFDPVTKKAYRSSRSWGADIYEIENQKYIFDSEGKCLVDRFVGSYYGDKNGHPVEGYQKIAGDGYYFNSNSSSTFGFVTLSDGVHFFSDIDNHKEAHGWVVDSFEIFYMDPATGVMQTTSRTIDGTTYNFDGDGKLLHLSSVVLKFEEGKWRGYDTNNKVLTGWQTIGGEKYYFNYYDAFIGNHSIYNDETGEYDYYYFSEEGKMQKDLLIKYKRYDTAEKESLFYYGPDGKQVTGWKTVNKDTYYFTSSGAYSGIKRIKDENDNYDYYYFDEDCKQQKELFVEVEESGEKRKYYFGSDGKRVKGWKTIDKDTYFFNPQALSGMQNISDDDGKSYYYYFDENCKLVKDKLIEMKDRDRIYKYYFDTDGKRFRGWKTIGIDTYYFGPAAYTGPARISNDEGESYYYFSEEGIMQKDLLIKHDNKYYYYGSDGKRISGWKTINGARYYFNIYDGAATGTKTIDDVIYTFSDEGKLLETVIPVDGVKLDKDYVELSVGESIILTATVTPADATNKKISWTSGNTDILKVDSDGKVTAVGEGSGFVEVVTDYQSFSAICHFDVRPETAESRIQSFVKRCYELILNREADKGGLNGWSDALIGKTATAAQIIDGFVRSDEFTKRNLSDDAKVDILYKTMLNRMADEGGKAGWVDALSKGYTLQNIIDGFCGSAEFTAMCKDYGIEPGSVGAAAPTDTSTPRGKIEAFVKRCYQLILNRQADDGGLKGWSDALEGKTAAAAQIIDGFVRSPEYINRSLTSDQSVTILYKTMLDRDPDEGGKAGWVDALSKGYTLQHIINGFCGSAEFTKICSDYGIEAGSVAVPARASVALEAAAQLEAKKLPDERIGNAVSADDTGITVVNGYEPAEVEAFVKHAYRAALGREADEAGLAGWTEQIVSGAVAPKAFLRTLLSSDEQIARKLNNEQFIEMLYRLYLNRGMDDAAAERIAQLAAGGLDEVIKGFEGSAEFRLVLNGFGL